MEEEENLVSEEGEGEEEESESDEEESEEENNREGLPFLHRLLLRRDNDNVGGGATGGATVNFDRTLPGKHTYFGTEVEVEGRTILEESQVQTVPLISMPGFILMPQQVFPLTVFHPSVISLLRRVLSTSKTFGVVNLQADSAVWKGLVGTTAEIFEYGEEDPTDHTSIGFKVKARGRQRFKLMSTRREIDGNLTGTVVMLPEIKLENPMYAARLKSCDRFVSWNLEPITPPVSAGSSETEYHVTINHPRQTLDALAPFPAWVYRMYDNQRLVCRLHEELRNCGILNEDVTVPRDPEQLSRWIATNIPIQNHQKEFLLGIDSSVQRLRAELSLLSQCRGRVLACKECSTELAHQSDIFSMSREGPSGAFINPGGHLHETLTLYKAKNLKLVGTPCLEYSWFPGYAWTIIECVSCFCHIGWKFTAGSKALKPEQFYGFSRKSIEAKIEAPEDGGAGQNSEDNIIVM